MSRRNALPYYRLCVPPAKGRGERCPFGGLCEAQGETHPNPADARSTSARAASHTLGTGRGTARVVNFFSRSSAAVSAAQALRRARINGSAPGSTVLAARSWHSGMSSSWRQLSRVESLKASRAAGSAINSAESRANRAAPRRAHVVPRAASSSGEPGGCPSTASDSSNGMRRAARGAGTLPHSAELLKAATASASWPRATSSAGDMRAGRMPSYARRSWATSAQSAFASTPASPTCTEASSARTDRAANRSCRSTAERDVTLALLAA